MPKAKRTTKLKQEILDLLNEHHLLTATQILQKLHEQGSKVNKTSVYRNLDSFLEDDVVCQQAFGDEFLYELQHDHHDHIRCKSCGRVEEIPCQIEVAPTIAEFVVDHHHLTVYGVCKSCQTK
jgi:Fe2+ or Zn2+ uptake regulation protein